MRYTSIIREFFDYLKEKKKWWLVPLIAFFILFGVLAVFSNSSPFAPFIYTLF